jgi:hypothetical protein
VAPLLEPEDPELPIFGHGCVEEPPDGGLVDGLDVFDDELDVPDDEPDDELVVRAVVAGVVCVVALATARPPPRLRPKAAPARARVTSGFRSCITSSFLDTCS